MFEPEFTESEKITDIFPRRFHIFSHQTCPAFSVFAPASEKSLKRFLTSVRNDRALNSVCRNNPLWSDAGVICRYKIHERNVFKDFHCPHFQESSDFKGFCLLQKCGLQVLLLFCGHLPEPLPCHFEQSGKSSKFIIFARNDNFISINPDGTISGYSVFQ